MRLLADQHLAGRRHLLEPSSDVDRITGHELLPFRSIAGNNLSSVHPDSSLQPKLCAQNRKPVTQVRGQFNLAVFELVHIKDEPGAKVVEARVGVYVNHSCFNGALPMMGVRRGDFTPDAPATFRFV